MNGCMTCGEVFPSNGHVSYPLFIVLIAIGFDVGMIKVL